MLPLLLLASFGLAKPFDFYSHGPYSSHVPRPEAILGYAPGERHTNFRDQERVMTAIAESAKDRVKVVQYGVTAEGRPLRIYIVSSPHNIARLSAIKAEHAELAKGAGDPAKTIPIMWINECIHGDETASFEAGMWTFYNLVAGNGSSVSKALESEVVIFNPVYNPDGHERYVVYYNSVATGSDDPNAYEDHEPSVVFGRLNHYRFDMNRDRVAFSQDETREEFAEMLRWNPQVYIDQHGQVGSYFFPPEPMSINTNVDRNRNAKWTDIFGRATGKAFDANGFSYYVKDEFDLFYPGYLDASTTLSGAIGMTHETDGGRLLAHKREDGSVLTLRQGMAKHFTSALAVAEATAAHAGSRPRLRHVQEARLNWPDGGQVPTRGDDGAGHSAAATRASAAWFRRDPVLFRSTVLSRWGTRLLVEESWGHPVFGSDLSGGHGPIAGGDGEGSSGAEQRFRARVRQVPDRKEGGGAGRREVSGAGGNRVLRCNGMGPAVRARPQSVVVRVGAACLAR